MTAPATGKIQEKADRLLRNGLFRSGLRTAMIRAISLALSLAVSVFLARAMGAQGLGVYTMAFAAISLLGLPVHMGLPTLVTRETARAHTAQDWPVLRGIWIWATRRILWVSAVVILGGVLITVGFSGLVDPEARDVFLLGLPLVPLIALARARSGALQG